MLLGTTALNHSYFYTDMKFIILSIWLEWLRINLPYYSSLMFIFFTPAYVLWELIWNRKWPHLLYYFIAFSVVGSSYAYFGSPNYIHALHQIFTNQFNFYKMSILFFSSFFWIGWAVLFFQLEMFLSSKLKVKEEIKPVKHYILWFFVYMVYLNAVVWIIQSVFGRYR